MSTQITLKPRLNEKTYAQAANGVYVFNVDTDVNKHTVARAVEAQFDVKVTAVNILNSKDKAKRTINITGKRAVNSNGRRNDTKKAYVTLAEGQSLPFFDAIDQAAEQEADTQAKIDQAAEKQAAKAEKPSAAKRLGLKRDKKEEDK